MLRSGQIECFLRDGFVRLNDAFPRELAEEVRTILRADTGCDPNDRSTWTKPFIRLNDHPQKPFRLAPNQPGLHEAFDQLVGCGAVVTADEPRVVSHSLPSFRGGGRHLLEC